MIVIRKFIKIFQNKVRILPKLDEEVLIGFNPFEIPVITLKDKIKVDLSVTR